VCAENAGGRKPAKNVLSNRARKRPKVPDVSLPLLPYANGGVPLLPPSASGGEQHFRLGQFIGH
jgi:hypothetical protein